MKINLILFFAVAFAMLPIAQAQLINIDSRTPNKDNQIADVDFVQIEGSWVVTAVERDGDTIQAQFGQQVGDVISLPAPMADGAAMAVT